MDFLCEFCMNIPFEQLPSEEELAHPHQPSLAALQTSATKCRLCKMILQSIDDVRRSIDKEARGEPEDRFLVIYPGTDSVGARVSTYFGRSAPANLNQAGGFIKPESSPLDTNYTGDVLRPWLFGNWWKIEDFTDDLYSDYSSPQLIGIGVRVSKSPRIHDAEGNSKEQVMYRGSGLRVRTYDDSPGASFIPGRMRTLDCRSSLAMRRLRQWLDNCDVYHTCIPKITELPPLPTRVLDIGHESSSQGIKLFETKGRPGRYIALSHCWGTSHRITTTQATLQAMKQGIPLSTLPRTFQEAVLISRDLGISYLWIDSLCIIQDSVSDWEQEASRMGYVYAYSYLTIAASSSVDDSSGCIPTIQTRSDMRYISPDAESMHLDIAPDLPPYILFRENEELPSYIFRGDGSVKMDIKTRQTDDKLSSLFITPEWMPGSSRRHPQVYSIGNFGSFLDPVKDEPLNGRGWTLQERTLAPRILHYGSKQMFWECNKGLLAEDGCRYTSSAYAEAFPSIESLLKAEFIPYNLHGLPPQCPMSVLEPTYRVSRERGVVHWILWQHGAHFHHQETPYSNISRYGRWNNGWISLVEAYSKRKLTRPEDKLPALAGLSRMLAQVTGDTYLAGVWRNHLPEDLFWRVYAREEPMELGKPSAALQAHYGATLSSVSKPATYRAPTWSWASIDSHIHFIQMNFDHIVSECLECYVEPSGSDVFGRVKDGYIYIKAPLIPLHPLRPQITPPIPYGIPVEVSVSAGIAPGVAYLDTRSEFPRFHPLALFLDWSNALVLARLKTKNNGEDVYHRIGIARFIWTQSQKDDYYRLGDVPPPPDRRGVFYCGPITEDDEKTVAKIL